MERNGIAIEIQSIFHLYQHLMWSFLCVVGLKTNTKGKTNFQTLITIKDALIFQKNIVEDKQVRQTFSHAHAFTVV